MASISAGFNPENANIAGVNANNGKLIGVGRRDRQLGHELGLSMMQRANNVTNFALEDLDRTYE